MNNVNITSNDLLIALDITRRLAEQRMVQPLMEYVATTIFELLPAERCLIIFFNENNTVQVQVARDRHGAVIEDAINQISNSIIQRVSTSMTPLLISDALNDDTLKMSQSVKLLKLRSVICVPLISYGKTIGVIYVENRSARAKFDDNSMIPLVLFSNQVAIALENTRMYEALESRVAERTLALREANLRLVRQAAELREQSYRDSLTGLHNRRYFNEIMPQIFDQTRRSRQPLSLAFADIDNFKDINDTLFHSGGDRVLMTVAHILHDNVRQADNVVRLGGEEFAFIMPETDLPTALQACERVRLRLEQYDWATIAPEKHITISIGLADDSGCANVQELMLRADTRLYIAKRLGKNRVVAVDG